jgi:tetratricopeptide (TPR) repeat protein
MPAYINLITMYADKTQLANVYEYCAAALVIDPDNAALYETRGIAYHKQTNVVMAIKDYQAALQLNAGLKIARYNLGLLYAQDNKIELAEQEFKELISRYPDYAPAYAGWGTVLYNSRRIRESRLMFEKAVKLDSEMSEAYYNLYQIYSSQGLQAPADKAAKRYFKLTGKKIPQ